MNKKTKHISFTYLGLCLVAFTFATLIQLFATANNNSQSCQSIQYSGASLFSNHPSHQNFVQTNNYSAHCLVEEELEENEDDTKKRNPLLFAYVNLFKSLFLSEKLHQFLIPHHIAGLFFSIPLYIINCIFLI